MFVGRPRFSGFVNSRVRVFIMIKLNGMWSFWAKPKPRRRRRKPKTTNHEGQQRSRASAEKETKAYHRFSLRPLIRMQVLAASF
jgi:hypothetical protein